MLARILEVEVMDTSSEAVDYDSMDHSEVNRRFVQDLLAAEPSLDEVLDLGTGTAQIPIELCRQAPSARVMAVDAAGEMLNVARLNVEMAGLRLQIMLDRVDAKQLPFEDGRFSCVMSNSIVHHIPEPLTVIQEAWRVLQPGGVIFFRDLLRPAHQSTLRWLVQTYAGGCNEHQRKMFSDSLRAALTLNEIRDLVAHIGGTAGSVAMTSDRHWTWQQHKPGG